MHDNKTKISNSHTINTKTKEYINALLSKTETDESYVSFDTDSETIIVDTGASSAMSMEYDDFIELNPHQDHINGIGNIPVEGKGTLKWNIQNTDGSIEPIIIRNAIYAPKLPIRLMSPQQFVRQQINDDEASFIGTKEQLTIRYENKQLNAKYHPENNLPTIHTKPGNTKLKCYIATNTKSKQILNKDYNMSLSQSQKELLKWHYKLGHKGMQEIQALARMNILPRHLSNTDIPICEACQYGKAHLRSKGNSPLIDPTKPIKPGDLIHVDQAISRTKGRCLLHSGKPTKAKWSVITIFKDHASKKIFGEFQQSHGADETITSKHRVEREANQCGVKITKYRADNGIFKSKAFQNDVDKLNQQLDFCGVDAHHQNGVAERAIRTIIESARTMLLHAMTKWPSKVTFDLWPFAVRQAINIYNNIPRKDLNWCTPEEVFAGMTNPEDRTKYSFIKELKTFGCPCYVLNTKSTPTKRLNKWTSKSTKCIYLGKSRSHASNVALVLNLSTDHISPQYHIVFDEQFTTANNNKIETKPPNNWDYLLTKEYWEANTNLNNSNINKTSYTFIEDWNSQLPKHTKEYSDVKISEGDWPPPDDSQTEILNKTKSTKHTKDKLNKTKSTKPTKDKLNTTKFTKHDHEHKSLSSTTKTPLQITKQHTTSYDLKDSIYNITKRITRSQQNYKRKSPRLNTKLTKQQLNAFYTKHEINYKNIPTFNNALLNAERLNTLLDDTINELQPMHVYAAATNTNPNILGHSAAMRAKDADEFLKSMKQEIDRLIEYDIFDVVDINTIPKHTKILRAIWSHRRKTTPSGEIYKYKSRICADGSQLEKGIDFDETFSPVVAWSTVRLLLILAITKGLKMRQVDYIQAFTQAELDDDVYMHIPAGFYYENPLNNNYKVLKLKRNLYGLTVASRNWFLKLSKGLFDRGFKPSEIDPCLYIKDDIICLVYVDDTIFFAKEEKVIDDMITELQKDFDLTDEGDVEAFLGIKIEHHTNGDISMSQPGLIDSILNDVGLKHDSKTKNTPATYPLLHKHENGAEREDNWDYRSIIGKLSYLCRNTRPDLEFAVHQCARFQSNPKRAHEEAIKRICRYLLGTKTKGIIMHPNNNLKQLNCYVDADFAGTYTAEISNDPTICRSRTGFVILYANCPVLWTSKLQTEIALSTVEAEYIALSQSLRELIPMKEILKELSGILEIPETEIKTHCTVFEDNKGAEELARTAKYRPRTKHIAIKYHHFRDHVRNGSISIERVDTLNQKADILTKPLTFKLFSNLRHDIQGWLAQINKAKRFM